MLQKLSHAVYMFLFMLPTVFCVLRLYQILATFSDFLGTFPKIVVHIPNQFGIEIFLLNFGFTPPQSKFPWQRDKNQENSHNSTTTYA